MNFQDALDAVNGTLSRPPISLFARRRVDGGTLLMGATLGFELPENVNDARIYLPAPPVFHEDLTPLFRGRSFLEIIQEGSELYSKYKSEDSKCNRWVFE